VSGATPNNTSTRIDQLAAPHFIGGFVGPEQDAGFGLSLSGGDVDGDGYSDILFGAPGLDAGNTNSGGAWLVYGRPEPYGIVTVGGSDLPGGTRFYTGVAGNLFGAAITCDDIDGDEYADIVMGSPGFDPPSVIGSGEGSAFVMYGIGQ